MTALKPCLHPKCLAPTARDTDALRGPLPELLCLEHTAIAMGLPVDALEQLAAAVTPMCQHARCTEPAGEITTWGNYCPHHWALRRKRK